MKVLVITDKDGPNLFIENIVKELVISGHEIAIYAQFQDDTSIRMFLSLNVPIHPLHKLDAKTVSQFDFIFCPMQSIRYVTFYNKYVFSYCNMNPAFDTVRGADFIFTLSPLRQPYERTFSYMPIGMPKNDTAVKAAQTDSRRILVVDSGHFPFSGKGKVQVAGMILDICKNFPDHEVCVKPRWLPGTNASVMTHVNLKHLYDYIDELCNSQRPDNLNLLMEHQDLQELIDGSRSVVTMCTTAYLDVALRGKGLIVAKGFDNDDMYQVRKDYFDRIYAHAEGSGCVADYHDVCRFLPEGLVCRPEHLTDTFTYTTGASGRAVEVMEYIYENYLELGVYPAIGAYDYKTWKTEMRSDPKLSMAVLKRWRMYCVTDSVVALNQSISPNIDWTEFNHRKKKLCFRAKPSQQGLEDLRSVLKRIKYRYLIEQEEQLRENEIDRSFYYAALFYEKKYDELIAALNLEKNDNCALQYYCGQIFYERKEFDLAVSCLSCYLEAAQGRPYLKYFVESEIYKRPAILYLLDIYSMQNNHEAMTSLLLFYINDRCFKLRNLKEQKQLHNFIAAGKRYCQSKRDDDALARLRKKDEEIKTWARTRIRKKIKQQIKKYGLFGGFKNLAGIAKERFFARILPFYKRLKKKKEALGRTLQYYRYLIGNSFGWFDEEQRTVLAGKDQYAGKSCVVIGNGPSLRVEDLEALQARGYLCFASNKIYKIFEQTDWRPDFYACTDHLVFIQNCQEIFSSIDCPIYLHYQFRKKTESKKLLKYVKSKTIYFLKYFYRKKKVSFYPDARVILSGGSVTYVLISLAWMMGFRTIYLIGCDHNYGTFTEQKVGAAIDPGSGINRDYFSENYMKPGEIINVGDLDKATEGYRVARDYIERHGGHLYNATRGGKLEVLERVDLDELLGQP